MITLQNITASLRGRTVLDDCNLAIEPGEALCIAGSDAEAKEVLILLLMGDLDPVSGTLSVDDVELPKLSAKLKVIYRRNVGVLLPSPLLVPDRSVAGNLTFILEMHGEKDAQRITERIRELLTRFELKDKAESDPHELSTFEKKKLALARALILEPKILLISNPERDLDDQEQNDFRALLMDEHNRGASLVIFSQDEKVWSAHGVRVLFAEDGRLCEKKTEASAPKKSEKSVSMQSA